VLFDDAERIRGSRGWVLFEQEDFEDGHPNLSASF
jgi:hypothetical protein